MLTKRISKHYGLVFVIWMLTSMSPSFAANQKPIAKAGDDQVVEPNSTVFLNGAESADKDGTIKTFKWTQTKGSQVYLLNADTASASFKSPLLSSKPLNNQLSFKLTVTDNSKKTASDTVDIKLVQCSAQQVLVNGVCKDNVALTCLPPKIVQKGLCVDQTVKTCQLPLELIAGECRLPSQKCTAPEVSRNGVCTVLKIPTQLNDTGITSCSDTIHNGIPCPVANVLGQDAEFGRDLLENDHKDGHAGFKFTKLDAQGQPLLASASSWSCVKDNVTGLIWENKSDKSDIHNKDLLFTNYTASFNPKQQYQLETDASGLVNKVNQEKLCGFNHWRLPSDSELHGIVDYSILYPGPSIDVNYFTARNLPYWTATAHASKKEYGWVVYFDDGRIWDDNRSQSFPVRLVHSSN